MDGAMTGNRVRLPWMVRDAGAHDHGTASDGVKTNFIEGGHGHILSDMKTVLTDGDHSHEHKEGVTQVSDGKHVHKVLLPDGAEVMTSAGGGDHIHEVLPGPKTSYESGQHNHSIKMPDGQVLNTLGHTEIQNLMDKIKKNFDIEEKPVTWGLDKIPVQKDVRTRRPPERELGKEEPENGNN